MIRIDSNYQNSNAGLDSRAREGSPEHRLSFSALVGLETDFSGALVSQESKSENARDQAHRAPGREKSEKQDRSTSNETQKQKQASDENSEKERLLVQERGPGSLPVYPSQKESELSPLPVRSIVHVADLERLVASIRAQQNGGLKTITVSLKHSVFEGLEFRIAFEQGRGLTADFIAPSERVQTAILGRTDEITRLFAERGVELGSLSVSLGSRDQKERESGDESSPRIEYTESSDSPAGQDVTVPRQSGTSYLT